MDKKRPQIPRALAHVTVFVLAHRLTQMFGRVFFGRIPFLSFQHAPARKQTFVSLRKVGNAHWLIGKKIIFYFHTPYRV